MRPLVLRQGLDWPPSRQHGWTCIFVAFLTLPVGLLVPLSLNDPGSLAAKDDFVAFLIAFADKCLVSVWRRDARCRGLR